MLRAIRKAEYTELIALFFIEGAALSAWLVPLSTVLDAHGLGGIRSLAFATTALAAFVSPLLFGALADRHAPPLVVLRWVALGSAAAMTLASTAIHLRWNPWLVLALIQVQALTTAPAFSITSAVVFARLADAQSEFGPVRSMATIGWMGGCWLVSGLGADTSAVAGYTGAALWLAVAGFTLLLPPGESPPTAPPRSWHERMGLDALQLLRNPNHRVVFITSALFSIPLAGFYPFAPPHLRDLGFHGTTAWMSFGQVTEVVAMFALGALFLRWRLKWIFAAGLGFGLARFLLTMCDRPGWVLAGITLHGAAYALFYITAQIYLDQRVDPAWRARAQALLALMNNGLGNLLGYLGTGWWFAFCARAPGSPWPQFWGGLAVAVGGVLVYFLAAYHGIGAGFFAGKHGSEAQPPAVPAVEKER